MGKSLQKPTTEPRHEYKLQTQAEKHMKTKKYRLSKQWWIKAIKQRKNEMYPGVIGIYAELLKTGTEKLYTIS